MELREVYMHIAGYVNITVEGFFVERFINSCFVNDIFLWNLERERTTYLKARVGIKDFRKLKKIARNTKCKIKIKNKKGLPILLHKYKKRKTFAIFLVLITIFIFALTRFIWNIEIIRK